MKYFLILFSILTNILWGFPSYKKVQVHEIDDLNENGTMDLTGWNSQKQYNCGGTQVYGRFGLSDYVTKTYSNIPLHDFVEITVRFYLLDTPSYNSNPDGNDIVIIRINDTQEQIQQGRGLGYTDGQFIAKEHMCGQSTTMDEVYIKDFQQFNYQSTTLKLQFQTKYDQVLDDESWAIRDINIKFYILENLQKVHTEIDLDQTTIDITGWTPQKKTNCGGNEILGNFGLDNLAQKTYTGIPEYRFVVMNMDIYLIDSIDYGHKDEIRVLLNDQEELGIIGKNFNSAFTAGNQNYCIMPDRNDMIVPEFLRQFTSPKTEFKLAVQGSYNESIDTESWGIRGLNMEFYNYIPYCPNPFILSDDQNWCICPEKSYLNTAGDDCIFCLNNQIVNDTDDGCTCPEQSYPNSSNDDCIFCNIPFVLNGTIDGCDCNIQGSNFDSVSCTCNGNFQYDSNSNMCVCPLSIPNYFNSSTCECENTFIFNNDQSDCKCPDQQIVKNGTCQNCSSGEYYSSNQCLNCNNQVCATCQTSSTQCILSCNNGCLTCDINQSCLSCSDGSYLETNKTCQPCNNAVCATCNTNPTTCDISCNGDCKQCDTTGSCISCVEGKFLSNGSCQSCNNLNCATCQNSSTECVLQCNSDCLTCGIDGSCLTCEDGKFSNNGQCQNCDNTQCATCSTSSTNCDSNCNPGCATCKPQGECLSCNIGEYLSGIECQPCDNQYCAICQNSSTQCVLQCNSDCLTCGIDGSCLTCEVGKFLNNGQCLGCDNTQCATCVISSTNCLLQCDQSCNHCDSQGNCLDCIDGDFLNNSLCEPCGFQCGTCVNQLDKCLSCSHNETRDINNDCLCKNGFFQVAQEIQCQECSFKCGSCQGTEDNCSTCINNSRSNPPSCDCTVGYYDDKDTGGCLQCKYNCACVKYDYCSYCLQTDSDLRSPKDCSCKQGYFEDPQGNCQMCSKKCQKCEGSANNCTVCTQIDQRNQQAPQCGCISGYYEDENNGFQCHQCPSQCLQCDNNQLCTECQNKDLSLPECLNRNQNSNYELIGNGNEIVIGICNVQCLVCENNDDNCTKCQTGLNRSQEIPDCNCLIGYHDNNNTQIDCQPCPLLCQNCQSQDVCQQCQQNSVLNPYNMQCQCEVGFKYNDYYQKCEECYYYYDMCYFQCPKNTQIDKKNKKCYDLQYSKIDNFVIFYISSIFVVLSLFSIVILHRIKTKNNTSKIHFEQEELKL